MVFVDHISSEKSELFTLLIQCVNDKLDSDKARKGVFSRVKDSPVRKIPFRDSEVKGLYIDRDSYSSSPRLSEPGFKYFSFKLEEDKERK